MAYFRCTTGGSGKGNTLVVTCADDLAGATITCTNGTKTYRKTCPSTSPYEVTFYGLSAGTYTVSATVSGNTYTTTVVITDYEAELGGFNWKTWVDLSQNYTSSDFTDLDDLLSDETAIRELMTIHACVDYLAGIATESADVETIIGNDLCAKWINNRDYALDTLYANEIIAGYMDTADKYFYGEWALMPQVPTMTGNTAPYGTASASSIYSSTYDAYKAFDGGNPTTSGVKGWLPSSGNIVGEKVYYNFTSACKVSKARVYWIMDGQARPTIKAKIVGSNDGSTWSAELSDEFTISDNGWVDVDCNTSNSYSYVGFVITSGDSNIFSTGGVKIQFYAWAPKGNVPVMTSNTAPYGEAIGNGASNGEAYRAFDGNEATSFADSSFGTSGGQRLAYKFTNPVNVKKLHHTSAAGATDTIKVQYSDDGTTWTDTGDTFTNTASISGGKDVDVTDSGYHLYWGIYCIGSTITSRMSTTTLQFYGRELSVSVPIMTGNTAPYGEASASSASSGYEAYKAFDNNTSTYWNTQNPNAGINQHITYHFTTPIVPKFMYLLPMYASSQARVKNFTVRGSNDGFVNDSHDLLTDVFPNQSSAKCFELNVSDAYSDIRLFVADNYGTADGRYIQITDLQFYGLDYSEKEFEEGTTKKWLYDHGVELETIDVLIGTGGSVTKNPSCIICKGGGTEIVNRSGAGKRLDLTPYSLAFTRLTSPIGGNNTNFAVTRDSLTVESIASIKTTPPLNEVVKSIDVSSINQTYYLTNMTYDSANAMTSFNELWLE